MNVQPFQIVAIIVWGVVSVVGLFVFALWQGSSLGAVAAIGTAACIWAFQHVDYAAGHLPEGAAPALALFVAAPLIGLASAAFSFFGV